MSSEQASVGGPAASFDLRPSLAAGSHAHTVVALIVANLGRSRPAAGA